MTHQLALAVLIDQLSDMTEPWVVSGSLAAALLGVQVTPSDVDLESTAAGARLIGERLSRFQLSPVTYGGTDLVRSHFGRFRVAGTIVEVMGDLQIRIGDGWCAPFLAGRDPVVVPTPAGAVPVASRAAMAAQYDRLGRPDRARALRTEGCQ
ncbi:hypothetical protein [Micromonospora sp. NBRC 101691]|uniref:nucleotidyltransferase domain-containing protein n=1 Tax=Micromonospora TaxID=1873 RepID=UPI0024A265B2|nr:hypothetical protein [Micromonospora sp. NBRC 101691]GLY26215.1 hypothetical protein Misp04_59460 [Micromonospora sp. NBRC 101691]